MSFACKIAFLIFLFSIIQTASVMPEDENLNSAVVLSQENSLSSSFNPYDFPLAENKADNAIVERNGTKYIIREGKEYILYSSGYYIKFDPALPSSFCEWEENFIVTVKGAFLITGNFYDKCRSKDGTKISIALWEDDLVGDDFIEGTTKYFYDYSSDCSKVYFTISWNLCLSCHGLDGGTEGSTIELYALADLLDDDTIFVSQSSENSNVDILYNCDCLSGACCSLASRPYKYKLSGSQPTGILDRYDCEGTNSPTGTSYVKFIDFYCDGSHDYAFSRGSTADTCGTCEYCTANDATCNYYDSSAVCGSVDCDYLDTACRDYYAYDKYCNGAGSCSVYGSSCDQSYTNQPKGTSCGSGKECDGSGTCVTCTSHNYFSCNDEDVYWFNKCDDSEDKKQECYNDGCSLWSYECNGKDIYNHGYLCAYRGCSNAACYSNSYPDELKYVKTCEDACVDGECVDLCYQNSDCGTNGWYGNPFCQDNDVYKKYISFYCLHPGAIDSSCTSIEENRILVECGSDYCGNFGANYCKDNDVYHSRTCHSKGCSNAECFDSSYTDEEKAQECGTAGCNNGNCNIVCYNNSDCGNPNWKNASYCSSEDVYDYWLIPKCSNPGTQQAFCYAQEDAQQKQDCGEDSCGEWENANYCKDNNVYHNKTCYDKGCNSGECFNNPNQAEEIIENCSEAGDWTNKETESASTSSADVDFGKTKLVAQTFSFSQNLQAYKACFYGRAANWGYDVNLKIYQTYNGKPYSSSLADATINYANIPFYNSLICANFSKPANLNANQQYALVVSSPSALRTSAHIIRRSGTQNPYSLGRYAYSANSGSSWQFSDSRYDLYFSVYGGEKEGIYSCDSGECKKVNCNQDSECGNDGYLSQNSCSQNDSVKTYRNYTCLNVGTANAACNYTDTLVLEQDCGESQCNDFGANYCKDNDVYHSRQCYDKGCNNGACFNNPYTDEEKAQECGTAGCNNGNCNIACYNDSDCGANGWVGNLSCSNDDLFQNFRNYTCNNPGTQQASCSFADILKLNQDCGESQCNDFGANYCKLDDVYQNRSCYERGCLNGGCFENSNSFQENLVNDCGEDYCTNWSANYCISNSSYHSRTCYDKGCNSAECFNNSAQEENLVNNCSQLGGWNNTETESASISSADVDFGKTKMVAQTFSFSQNLQAYKACFYGRRNNLYGYVSDASFKIYYTNDGKPNGSSLADATINYANIPFYNSLICANFSKPANLNANQQYALVISSIYSEKTSTYTLRRSNTQNPYSLGRYAYSANSGSSWQFSDSNYDLYFYVYGGRAEGDYYCDLGECRRI